MFAHIRRNTLNGVLNEERLTEEENLGFLESSTIIDPIRTITNHNIHTLMDNIDGEGRCFNNLARSGAVHHRNKREGGSMVYRVWDRVENFFNIRRNYDNRRNARRDSREDIMCAVHYPELLSELKDFYENGSSSQFTRLRRVTKSKNLKSYLKTKLDDNRLENPDVVAIVFHLWQNKSHDIVWDRFIETGNKLDTNDISDSIQDLNNKLQEIKDNIRKIDDVSTKIHKTHTPAPGGTPSFTIDPGKKLELVNLLEANNNIINTVFGSNHGIDMSAYTNEYGVAPPARVVFSNMLDEIRAITVANYSTNSFLHSEMNHMKTIMDNISINVKIKIADKEEIKQIIEANNSTSGKTNALNMFFQVYHHEDYRRDRTDMKPLYMTKYFESMKLKHQPYKKIMQSRNGIVDQVDRKAITYDYFKYLVKDQNMLKSLPKRTLNLFMDRNLNYIKIMKGLNTGLVCPEQVVHVMNFYKKLIAEDGSIKDGDGNVVRIRYKDLGIVLNNYEVLLQTYNLLITEGITNNTLIDPEGYYFFVDKFSKKVNERVTNLESIDNEKSWFEKLWKGDFLKTGVSILSKTPGLLQKVGGKLSKGAKLLQGKLKKIF